MSARVEAAAKAAHEHDNAHCPSFTWESTAEGWRKADMERQSVALTAADSVMFSEAAIERAAKALCVKRYPMTEGFWSEVDPDFREKCRDQARAVVAALREEA